MANVHVQVETEMVEVEQRTVNVTLNLDREEFLTLYAALDHYEYNTRGARDSNVTVLMNQLNDAFNETMGMLG